MKNQWWLERAGEIQGYADGGQLKEFYESIKEATGPTVNPLVPVRTEDGSSLLKDKAQILNRYLGWYEPVSYQPTGNGQR